MNNDTISIGEFSRLVGVSAHTIRYYEAEGILKPAARAANGHRRFRADDALWLEFVLRLKLTGMPLAEIKQYAALRAKGDTTLMARLTMLELHHAHLLARIDELSRSANALDDKMRIYRRMVAKTKIQKRKAKT